MNLVDPKPSSDMPAPLSSVTHGQPFTKECLDEKSFGINDFLTRYEAEEVEWFLNKPIDKNKGNTLLHEAVFSQSTKQMEIILKHGGNYILCIMIFSNLPVFFVHYRLSKCKRLCWKG